MRFFGALAAMCGVACVALGGYVLVTGRGDEDAALVAVCAGLGAVGIGVWMMLGDWDD